MAKRRRGTARKIPIRKTQRLDVSVYELRFPGEEPTELHDFIMDAFVNDHETLGATEQQRLRKARRMLAQCKPPAEIIEHEVT